MASASCFSSKAILSYKCCVVEEVEESLLIGSGFCSSSVAEIGFGSIGVVLLFAFSLV